MSSNEDPTGRDIDGAKSGSLTSAVVSTGNTEARRPGERRLGPNDRRLAAREKPSDRRLGAERRDT